MQDDGATSVRSENQLVALFRIPLFRRMWAAITLSSLGDWLGLLANTALAQQLTREQSIQVQGAAISGVFLVRLAPDLLFGPVAAALADKLDRRRIVIIGEVAAAILYASIAIGYNLLWLYIAQFVIEAVGLFTQPAKQAIWVSIMPKKMLATGNQLSLISVYGAVPVAAAIFASLSAVNRLFGGATTALPDHVNLAIVIALLFDSLTFLISATTVFLCRHLITAVPGERERGQSIITLLREGISYVRNHRLISSLYLGIIGAFAAGGLTVGVAQLWVATMSAGAAGYSIMFGTVFTGLAIGMLAGPRLLPRLNRPRVFCLSIGGAGIALMCAAFIRNITLAFVFAAIIGFFAGMAWIIGYTLIGQEVVDRMRGRIFAFVLSSVRLTLLFTIAIGSNLAGLIGTHSFNVGNDSQFIVSGPGMTLFIGGCLALLVSWFVAARLTPSHVRFRSLLRRWALRAGVLSADDHAGLFITVDGATPMITAAYTELIASIVRDSHVRLTRTSENLPGAATGVEPETAALRSAADRSEHVAGIIRPALNRGEVVLCDRYVLTSMAIHGAGGGADVEGIRTVNSWSTAGLLPDLGIVIPTGPDEVREAFLFEAGIEPDRYLVCPPGVPEALPDEVVARLSGLLVGRSGLLQAVTANERA